MQEPTSRGAELPRSGREALDNPWLVLAMLFFVTAALGLPLLWMSRGFTPLWKAVLSVIVLAWTALLLWLFWLIMAWAVPRTWETVQQLMR